MIIDSHQHFWKLKSGYHSWLTPKAGPLYRDFEPDELAPLLDQSGVTGTVLVQAADTTDEIAALWIFAAKSGFVSGIVGGLLPTQGDGCKKVQDLAKLPLLVGFRPPISELVSSDGALRESGLKALAAMAEHEMSLDYLVRGEALQALPNLLDQTPALTCIIDHAGNPNLTGTAPSEAWRAGMKAAARHPSCHCKISGLLTHLPAGASLDVIRAHIDILVEIFTPGRLMWGSDWPVLTKAASYPDWLDICRDQLADLSSDDLGAIFGGTAHRAYRLKEAVT